MFERARRLDGFHTTSALLGIFGGPFLLWRGGPAGWSLLLVVAGLTILSAQWATAHDVTFDLTDRTQGIVLLFGALCIGVATVYLTRAANDLPSLFPGHDGDSEHFRILPGVMTLVIGLVGIGRALPSIRVTTASRLPSSGA